VRCRKCDQKAVINMRQHKLALCKEHFLNWILEQTQRFIEKYQMFSPQEKLLVAVSGGKDSLSLWDILWRLGYQADGLYIGLGIDEGVRYSEESHRLTVEFAAERNLKLHVVDIQSEYGQPIPVIAQNTTRGKGKPCSVCGLSKRHVMNRIAREGGYDVLVTGHNLDDEAAVLFANTMNWIPGYLVRQSPVLEANRPGLVRKVKPLCRIYEREMAAYALLRGIEYIYDECPFATGSKQIYYKEVLNKLEADRPGAKLSFYLSYLQAKDNGLFAPQADRGVELLHSCPSCGQPTSAPGECAFCRMVVRITESV
jgi:tRNA-5-methyluridine54 2-sulfurtransferase